MTEEIRRGDAICIPWGFTGSSSSSGSNSSSSGVNSGVSSGVAVMGTDFNSNSSKSRSWFRVATAELNNEKPSVQLSVTSQTESMLRGSGIEASVHKKIKTYHDSFTAQSLPLDGDFDGNEVYNGVAYRYGCSNDVRLCWLQTKDEVKKLSDEKSLEAILKKESLISQTTNSLHRQKVSYSYIKPHDVASYTILCDSNCCCVF